MNLMNNINNKIKNKKNEKSDYVTDNTDSIEKVIKEDASIKKVSFKDIIENKKNGNLNNVSFINKNDSPKRAFGKDKSGSKPFKNR